MSVNLKIGTDEPSSRAGKEMQMQKMDVWHVGKEEGGRNWESSVDTDILLLFSHWVVSSSLRPHGLQHTMLPCPSLSPRAYSNSRPLSQWCHPTILSSVVPSPPSIFPSNRVFSTESALRIRWPKYWSFSFTINPSNEYSGLISFRIDWFDLLAVQGTLKSLF